MPALKQDNGGRLHAMHCNQMNPACHAVWPHLCCPPQRALHVSKTVENPPMMSMASGHMARQVGTCGALHPHKAPPPNKWPPTRPCMASPEHTPPPSGAPLGTPGGPCSPLHPCGGARAQGTWVLLVWAGLGWASLPPCAPTMGQAQTSPHTTRQCWVCLWPHLCGQVC